MEATDKQVDYILDLYNQIHGTSCRFLTQCKDLALTSRRAARLTVREASEIIDELKMEV